MSLVFLYLFLNAQSRQPRTCDMHTWNVNFSCYHWMKGNEERYIKIKINDSWKLELPLIKCHVHGTWLVMIPRFRPTVILLSWARRMEQYHLADRIGNWCHRSVDSLSWKTKMFLNMPLVLPTISPNGQHFGTDPSSVVKIQPTSSAKWIYMHFRLSKSVIVHAHAHFYGDFSTLMAYATITPEAD